MLQTNSQRGLVVSTSSSKCPNSVLQFFSLTVLWSPYYRQRVVNTRHDAWTDFAKQKHGCAFILSALRDKLAHPHDKVCWGLLVRRIVSKL